MACTSSLPNVIISIALYGNPTAPDACPGRCTIGQYAHLKDTCGDLVDVYLYQNYANQVNDQTTNKKYIEDVGNLFGWEKFGFGVGVGNDPWRWYPDQPGTNGREILSTLLSGPNGKHMRGVRSCIPLPPPPQHTHARARAHTHTFSLFGSNDW